MTRFRVWAPQLEHMQLRLEGAAHDLTQVGEHFELDLDAPDGAEYELVVEGDALPDPRSPLQPHGVHGPSAVDERSFAWTDAHWNPPPLRSAVIYELHTGTFTPEGTFDAIVERLPHLLELGVSAIELMPVAEFPGERGWGYDGVDLYAPHHAYGGPEALRRLVNACHQLGLAVILDVVYNHLGPDGNHLSRFGPYFTDRYRTPWGDALNLDGPGSDGVREHLLDNAVRWLRDFHIDGLRLDAVHAILDSSATHLLEELQQRVRALEAATGRRHWLIAESDLNDPRVIRAPELGGYGMDAQWSDDFHHAMHALLTGERSGYYADFGSVADVATAVRRGFVYAGQHSRHRGRRHGRPATGLAGWSLLGYMQNHDQVGNRALGERSSQLLSTGLLQVAAALVLLSPFVPMLFMGEEWGASTPFLYFTDHQDEALARAVSEGRRSEFAAFEWRAEDVPDPQALKTFGRSRLDWSELERSPHAELLRWHRRLIALRRSVPALSDGRLDTVEVESGEQPPHLVMTRGPLTLACNFSEQAVEIARPPGAVVLASVAEPTAEDPQTSVILPPESARISITP